MAAFADHAAIAIDNADLHEQSLRYTVELEQRVAERTAALQAALEQAEIADRAKSQFVANVSHELRTPLANFMLYLDLLVRGQPEKRQSYLKVLHGEASRLRRLIESLLEFPQLNSHQVPFRLQPVDLNQLIHEVVRDRSPSVQEAGLTLTFQAAQSLPLVDADPELLRRVLSNLLANAIQYTPFGGRITIQSGLSIQPEQSWVTIQVADTGPGISTEELPHLFERFYRGQAALNSGTPGIGLGLALTHEIIYRHGGRLTVDSQPGQGATFTVWLPHPQSAPKN